MNNGLSKSNRLMWLDAVKGFGIISVVFIHNCYDVSPHIYTYILKWITSFHMMLFFIASGFCFKSEKLCFKYLKQKAKSLMIPYIFWGIIIGEIFSNLRKIVQGYDFNWKQEIIGIFTGKISYLACWFLLVLFLVYILEFIIFKLFSFIKKDDVYEITIGISHIIILTFGYFLKEPYCNYFKIRLVFIASAFVYFGFILRKFIKLDLKIGTVTLIVGSILSFINGKVTFSKGEFSNPILAFVVAIFISYGIFCVFSFLEKYENKIFNLLCYFGKNTIEILCTHFIFIYMIRIFEKVLKIEIHTFPPIIATFIIMIIEYFLIKYVFNKIDFLFGKKRKENILCQKN